MDDRPDISVLILARTLRDAWTHANRNRLDPGTWLWPRTAEQLVATADNSPDVRVLSTRGFNARNDVEAKVIRELATRLPRFRVRRQTTAA